MATRKHAKEEKRFRVGSLSVYKHRRSWWLYYRENGTVRRRRASEIMNAGSADHPATASMFVLSACDDVGLEILGDELEHL